MKRAIPFSQVEAREPSWLWPDYIVRGAVNLVVGQKDVGKTTFACWLAAKVTTELDGYAFVDTTEDDIHVTLRPRLEAAGADLSRVTTRTPTEPPWQFKGDEAATAEKELTDYLDSMPKDERPGLVVFDSLAGFVPRYTQPEAGGVIMDRLTLIAQKANVAVVFIHHYNKSGKTLDAAIGGAGAITRVARIVHVLGEEPKVDFVAMLFPTEDPDEVAEAPKLVLATHKMNIAPKPKSILFEVDSTSIPAVESVRILRAVGTCDHSAEDVFKAMRSSEQFTTHAEDNELQHAIYWLVETLAERPQKMAPTKELILEASEQGIAKRTLERARAELGIKSIPPARLGDYLTPEELEEASEAARRGWWMRLEVPDAPPE